MLCPHIVFTCCVCISEQRAITFLYRINRPIFITETFTQRYYYFVFQTVLWLRLLVSGLSSQRTGFQYQVRPCEIVVDRVALELVFSHSSSVFRCQYHSTNVPRSSSATCCSYKRGKREKSGNLTTSKAPSEIGGTG